MGILSRHDFPPSADIRSTTRQNARANERRAKRGGMEQGGRSRVQRGGRDEKKGGEKAAQLSKIPDPLSFHPLYHPTLTTLFLALFSPVVCGLDDGLATNSDP